MKGHRGLLRIVVASFVASLLWACADDTTHTQVVSPPVAELQTPSTQQTKNIPTAEQLAVGKRTILARDLPAVGKRVYRLIWRGGPFPYDKDGAVFGNRERLLPSRPRGYYHEYTVATAQASSRGAKRIVCGGRKKTPSVCYYTADHYASFLTIIP